MQDGFSKAKQLKQREQYPARQKGVKYKVLNIKRCPNTDIDFKNKEKKSPKSEKRKARFILLRSYIKQQKQQSTIFKVLSEKSVTHSNCQRATVCECYKLLK